MAKTPSLSLQDDCSRVFHSLPNSDVFGRLDGATVLITGGSGFLGSWICVFLNFLRAHANIRCTVYLVARNESRFLHHQTWFPGLPVVVLRQDVRPLSDLPKDVNYIVHAAGSPDSRLHHSSPMETLDTISAGASSLFRSATRLSYLRSICYLSSGSVYGPQPVEIDKIAEDQPQAPLANNALSAVYAQGKRFSEALCHAARNELRLPVLILRPFTFLGPFQPLDAPWAINNFMNDGLNGRPIRILGDGTVSRSFLYGAEAAGWVLLSTLSAPSGAVYNLGGSVGYTLTEIANKVADNFHPRPEVILNASLLKSPPQLRYQADMTRFFNDYGVHSVFDLDFSLQRTIEWHRQHSNGD